jgi:hypothetical protein
MEKQQIKMVLGNLFESLSDDEKTAIKSALNGSGKTLDALKNTEQTLERNYQFITLKLIRSGKSSGIGSRYVYSITYSGLESNLNPRRREIDAIMNEHQPENGSFVIMLNEPTNKNLY